MKRFVLLALVSAALVGCGSTPRTPTHECPLDTLGEAKCASVERAHQAAVSADVQGQRRVQSVFDPRVQAPTETAAQPFFNGQLNPMPEPSQNGMPVFQQPRVMRVWIAPYVDADGNLRSGEYAYINTPGAWSYGGLKRPGAAAGMFGPARPNNLGFAPNIETPGTSSNAGRAATPAAPVARPAAPAVTPSAPAEPVSGITQPYQRLAPAR